jgi:hypothetical protein
MVCRLLDSGQFVSQDSTKPKQRLEIHASRAFGQALAYQLRKFVSEDVAVRSILDEFATHLMYRFHGPQAANRTTGMRLQQQYVVEETALSLFM